MDPKEKLSLYELLREIKKIYINRRPDKNYIKGSNEENTCEVCKNDESHYDLDVTLDLDLSADIINDVSLE